MNEFNFNKKRRVGAILEAVIFLYRTHAMFLFKTLLIICSPFILLESFFLIDFKTVLTEIMTNTQSFDLKDFILKVSLYILSAMAIYLTVNLTTSHLLIMQYNQEEITFASLYERVKKTAPKIIIANILLVLILILAFLLLIPGIYLAIAASLTNFIMLYENKSFSEAFTRSLNLTRDYWWNTLGVYLLIGIIITVLSMMISIPMAIVSEMININNPTGVVDTLSTFFIISNIVNNSLVLVLYPASYMTAALWYFNLVERKESSGLLHEIDKMGN